MPHDPSRSIERRSGEILDMVNRGHADRIFQITNTTAYPFISALFPVVSATLENVLSFPRLNRLYDEVSRKKDHRHFLEKTLEALNICYDISEQGKGIS